MIFHMERAHLVANAFCFFQYAQIKKLMNVVSMNTIALRQEFRSGRKTKSSGALLLQQTDF